jgi:protein-S-isoprenylcysteine O-methyltransferase Ste14
MAFLAAPLSIVCFAGFAWAIQHLFMNPTGIMTVRMKALSSLGLVFFVAQLAALYWPAPQPNQPLQIVGLALFLIAIGLFWWTVPYARRAALRIAFTTHEPDTLMSAGPYRFVRHPFYSSYISYWLAGVLVSQQWLLLISLVVMSWFYISAMIHEERAFLSSKLRDQYKAYRARTGALLPTFGLFSAPSQKNV